MQPTSYKGEIKSGFGGDYLEAVPLYGQQPTPPPVVQPKISPAVVTSAPAVAQTNQNADFLKKQQDIKDQIKVLQTELDRKLALEKTDAEKNKKKTKVVDSIIEDTAKEKNLAFDKYLSDANSQLRQLDRVQTRMNAANSSLIDSIRRNYDSVIAEQEQTNRAYEGGITTAGLVSGRNQYAPDFQNSLLARATTAGIKEVEKLQNKRDQLIAEAQFAMEEGNYAHVQKKMELIRQNYLDEQQAAKDLATQTAAIAEAERERIKAEREDYDYSSEQVAPLLADQLSGNEASDNAIISEYANELGVPFYHLYSAVNRFNQDRNKALPSEIYEYETAKRKGYIPASMTLSQYRQSKFKASTGGSTKKLTTLSQAALLGNTALEGVSQDEIRNSMLDKSGKLTDIPPQWFVDNIKAQVGEEATPEKIKEAWNLAKQDEDVLDFVYGKGSNPTDEEGGF